MQAFAAVQETPSREALTAPVGLGTLLSDHSLPFQRSANGLLAALPTARQLLELEQETLSSASLASPWAGSGEVCWVQVVPFQLAT